MTQHLDAYFKRAGVVDVPAAVVGIRRTAWVGLSTKDATERNARSVMQDRRFDILPIEDQGKIRRYFSTSKWNDFSDIREKEISHKDVMPFDTPIKEVIKGLALGNRNSFFLASDREIAGLVSISNLNCRQIRVYLYSLLSELEVSLSQFITERLDEDKLVEVVLGDRTGRGKKDIEKRFNADRSAGIEVPFVEYLYLSDLSNVINKADLHEQLGLSRSRSVKILGSLTNFRNKVAHPVRSILEDESPAQYIWKQIDQIDEMLFALDK